MRIEIDIKSIIDESISLIGNIEKYKEMSLIVHDRKDGTGYGVLVLEPHDETMESDLIVLKNFNITVKE